MTTNEHTPRSPFRRPGLLRALAAGCAATAMPFGAPVRPHAITELLRAGEPRR